MALVLSIFALLATFYQLYLQRVHNEKSLQPLVQVDLKDFDKLIGVFIQNNGLGPFIFDRLSFVKDGHVYHSISECISLDPQSYHNIPITETTKKVILPNSFLDVFSIRFKEQDTLEYMTQIRQELSALKLIANGRDIYDNKIMLERELNWFVR